MSEDSPSTAPERRSWLERLSLAFSGEPQTRDDLVEILRDARENGLLDADQLRMLEGALSVSERQVGDNVARPRRGGHVTPVADLTVGDLEQDVGHST